MSHMIHELADEFPEHAAKMEVLKIADKAFAKLFNDYQEINRQVVEAETHEHPTEHFREEDMKKQRAHLKDEIYKMLIA